MTVRSRTGVMHTHFRIHGFIQVDSFLCFLDVLVLWQPLYSHINQLPRLGRRAQIVSGYRSPVVDHAPPVSDNVSN